MRRFFVLSTLGVLLNPLAAFLAITVGVLLEKYIDTVDLENIWEWMLDGLPWMVSVHVVVFFCAAGLLIASRA